MVQAFEYSHFNALVVYRDINTIWHTHTYVTTGGTFEVSQDIMHTITLTVQFFAIL